MAPSEARAGGAFGKPPRASSAAKDLLGAPPTGPPKSGHPAIYFEPFVPLGDSCTPSLGPGPHWGGGSAAVWGITPQTLQSRRGLPLAPLGSPLGWVSGILGTVTLVAGPFKPETKAPRPAGAGEVLVTAMLVEACHSVSP